MLAGLLSALGSVLCLLLGVAFIRIAIQLYFHEGAPGRVNPRRFAMWTDMRTGKIHVRRTED